MQPVLESKPFMEFYKAILGTEDFLPESEEGIRTLRSLSQSVKIGEYSNAFSSALHLLADADSRVPFFLDKGIPSMQGSLPVVKYIYESVGDTSDVDALHEGLFVINGCSLLRGYREPAETIVKYISALTGEDLTRFLEAKETERLDQREREAYKVIQQYTETFEQEPLPYISPESEGQTRDLILQSMRQNPSGIPILAVAKVSLDMFNKSHNGLFYPRLYGFQTGSMRYASALDRYFK